MKITLTIDIPKLKTTKEGQEWGKALAEHIVDLPVNRDNSIKSISYSVPRKGNA